MGDDSEVKRMKYTLTQNHLDTLKITSESWWDGSSCYLKGNVVEEKNGLMVREKCCRRQSGWLLCVDSSEGQTEYYSSSELAWTSCLTAGSDTLCDITGGDHAKVRRARPPSWGNRNTISAMKESSLKSHVSRLTTGKVPCREGNSEAMIHSQWCRDTDIW